MATKRKLAVVAVGGNALIVDKDHQSIQDQSDAAALTAHHVADMVEAGWNVILTHGSGPQVGFFEILRRDRSYARYQLYQFTAGSANMIIEAPLVYLVTR